MQEFLFYSLPGIQTVSKKMIEFFFFKEEFYKYVEVE